VFSQIRKLPLGRFELSLHRSSAHGTFLALSLRQSDLLHQRFHFDV
jgi:hypothetical protein